MSCTTRQLLDQIKQFHEQLARVYAQIGAMAVDPRAKLMLDYMSEHESHFEKTIEDYETDSPAWVMDFNIKFPVGIELESFFEELRYTPDISTDDVLRIAIGFNERLLTIYNHLAEEAECPVVSSLFDSLGALEKHDRLITVRNTMELSII